MGKKVNMHLFQLTFNISEYFSHSPLLGKSLFEKQVHCGEWVLIVDFHHRVKTLDFSLLFLNFNSFAWENTFLINGQMISKCYESKCCSNFPKTF